MGGEKGPAFTRKKESEESVSENRKQEKKIEEINWDRRIWKENKREKKHQKERQRGINRDVKCCKKTLRRMKSDGGDGVGRCEQINRERQRERGENTDKEMNQLCICFRSEPESLHSTHGIIHITAA